MKVSLSTACLYVYPLEKTFQVAKRAGFDGVELVIGPELEWRGGKYAAALSEKYRLPIFTVHPPVFGYPGWSRVHTSIEPYLDRALRLTREAGAPLLVLHMPRARGSDDRIGRGFFDKLLSTRERLNGTGPRLALENSSCFRQADHRYILRPLADLRRFADEHDFPMTLDTAHVGTWGLDLLDALDYFDGRLMNVHLSDLKQVPGWMMRMPELHSYFRQHQLPGSGYLPLAEFLRKLRATGYQGPVTYELSPVPLKLWSPARTEQILRECVQFVRDAAS